MNDHRNWGTISRNYLTAKSKQAGSPLCLNLLPGAPCIFNPCWKAAPSFAACELLAGSGCEASSSSASFSRIFWCLGASNLYFVTATPYEHLASSKHRARQLLPSVVRNVLEAHHQTEAEQKSAESGAIARRTASIMRDLAADMQSWAIRSLGWVLTHTFRWLFGGEIYVDQAGLKRLKVLHSQGIALVYVPTHKSHIDYLMLSYILFSSGLPCPHIAAGDNLSLPIIGRWLRHCGAFFIRRTSHGDRDGPLYKQVLAVYVRSLLEQGHSVEFFIEGGRSRDGRVNVPKLGLLSYVVDAVIDGDSKQVVCVPVTMSYDVLVEEKALAKQLAGASKHKESLGGLVRTVLGLARNALSPWSQTYVCQGAGGFYGRASVRFGREIQVDRFLQENRGCCDTLAGGAFRLTDIHGDEQATPLLRCFPKGSRSRRSAVAKLGEQIVTELRTCNVLPTAVLVAGAMEAALAQKAQKKQSPNPDRFSIVAPHHPTPSPGTLRSRELVACWDSARSNGMESVPAWQTGHCPGVQGNAQGAAMAHMASEPHHGPTGVASPVDGVPLETLQRAVDWLAAELEDRGAAVMKLPSVRGQGGHAGLLHVLRLLAGCLAANEASACGKLPGQQYRMRPPMSSGGGSSSSLPVLHAAALAPAAAAPSGICPPGAPCQVSDSSATGAAGGQPLVLCKPGVQATLRQHGRLSQLLPWVVGEGLVTCALLGEQQMAVQCGSPRNFKSSSSSGGGAGRSEGISWGAVCRRALWLRQLLAREVNTALSQGALATEESLGEVVDLMVQRGALACTPVRPGASSCPGSSLRLAPAGTGRDWALFCARILSPFLATYAAVLRAVHGLLCVQSEGVPRKVLMQEAQAQLLQQSALQEGAKEGGGGGEPGFPPRVIPSLVLVQGALAALTELGVLVSDGEAGASSPRTARLSCAPRAAGVTAVKGDHAVSRARQLEPELQVATLGPPEQGNWASAGQRGEPSGQEKHGSGFDCFMRTRFIGIDVDSNHSFYSQPSPENSADRGIGDDLPGRRGDESKENTFYEAGNPKDNLVHVEFSTLQDTSKHGASPDFDPGAASVGADLCEMEGSLTKRRNRRRPECKGGEASGGQEVEETPQVEQQFFGDSFILGEAVESTDGVHNLLQNLLASCAM